jgi:hypothetical protein
MAIMRKKSSSRPKRRTPRAESGSPFERVRAIGLGLPGVEESTSYGTPALKVKGKLLVRLREDGVTLVVIVEPGTREVLMRARPKTYFITDHYAPYPQLMLVDLASVRQAELRGLIEDAWHLIAPPKLDVTRKAPRRRAP